jgi:hypothetical protein
MIEEGRRFLFLGFLGLLFFFVSSPVLSKENVKSTIPEKDKLPNQLGEFINNSPSIKDRVYFGRGTPELHTIKLDPAQPIAGKPVKVTVEIYNASTVGHYKTKKVVLFYGLEKEKICTEDEEDGFLPVVDVDEWSKENFRKGNKSVEDSIESCDISWKSITLKTKDGRIWKGAIPPLKSGSRVIYAIRAVDTAGGVYATVPCKTSFDRIALMGYVENDCVHTGGKGVAGGNRVMPKQCMMKMALPVGNPYAGKGDRNAANMDIVDVRVAHSDDAVILDVAVKGRILTGTANPFRGNAFIALAINPEKDVSNGGTLKDAIGDIFYSAIFPEFVLYMVPECHYGFNKGIDYETNNNSISCLIEDNHLVYTIKKKALGLDEVGRFKFMTTTEAVTNIYPFKWILYDYTPFTTVDFTENNVFTVK